MVSGFEMSGILGLICITISVLILKNKYKKQKYIILIIGGILLEVYSISLRNLIFIILQAVFVLASIYGLIELYILGRKK